MERADTLLAGQLLVAMPQMLDERFDRSVIYLCAHSPQGAMGLVVNRPLAQPTFPELLKQLSIDPTPSTPAIRLLSGGPVENTRGFVLHTSDWTAEASLRVDDRLALTANVDILKAIALGDGPSESLLALGYAGWGPGQLDAEIQQNTWLIVPLQELTLIFDDNPEHMWHRALASMRVDPSLLSSTAGHA